MACRFRPVDRNASAVLGQIALVLRLQVDAPFDREFEFLVRPLEHSDRLAVIHMDEFRADERPNLIVLGRPVRCTDPEIYAEPKRLLKSNVDRTPQLAGDCHDCRTDPARLKGIAMINLDDVPDGIKELERAARLGLSCAMITEYPAEDRRYDQPEYEAFWAAAAALDLPLSLHTATRRRGRIRGVGDKTLRDASSRATKAFYPALSLCDLIFSGVFERHPRLTLAIV
jgi:hypothetical protein